MNIGLRTFKSASLRIAAPSLPAEASETVRQGVFEVVGVRSDTKRQGHATALLNAVCAEADQGAKVLMLMVDQPDDAAMSNKQLIHFYERHGFKPTKDDFGAPVVMVRAPVRQIRPRPAALAIALIGRA